MQKQNTGSHLSPTRFESTKNVDDPYGADKVGEVL